LKRIIALLLVLSICLSLPCMAADRDIDRVMKEYMAEHRLNEENFAMGWCDLVSGETWFFGEDNFMVAGSMYKVPLAMAVYDAIERGEISPDDITRNFSVERALEKSIVKSDNDAAQALRFALSHDNDVYRARLAAYSGYELTELPAEYYLENNMSPKFMLNTLKHIYANRDKYAQLIDYMRLSHPDRYFKMDNAHLDIAHKYGSFEGAANDCAIVFASRPFALVVFTQSVTEHKQIMSEICAMMAERAEVETMSAEERERFVELVAAAAARAVERVK